MLSHRNPARRRHARRSERGDIMLVTMVFLLLCLLGLIGSMRDTVVATNLASNNLARQRDTQVADMAAQYIRNQIRTNSAAGISLVTQSAVTNQLWWRDTGATAAAAPPTADYWRTCLGNSDAAQRCGAITLTSGGSNLPYTALAFVQPTGRIDKSGTQCNTNGTEIATFYAVYVHVQESNGATSVNTESVYQACEQA